MPAPADGTDKSADKADAPPEDGPVLNALKLKTTAAAAK